MAGSYNLFDGQQLTTEHSSRNGVKIDTLQIHHATMTSISGLISLMMPGGRDVSANGALANDGFLWEVAPATQRAFTSGVASQDRRAITVECCNTSLAPAWGISAATRTRLARLAVAMYKAGLLGSLTRQHIIGHNEVPGTYATACPGPDMHLDWIVAEAQRINNGGGAPAGGGGTPVPTNGDEMSFSLIKDAKSATIWVQSMDTGLYAGVANTYHITLLQRARRNDANDPMLQGELDIVRGYLSLIDPAASKDRTAEVLAALSKVTIDPAAVKAAVLAALAEGPKITAEVNPEDLDAFGERFAKILGIRLAGGDI